MTCPPKVLQPLCSVTRVFSVPEGYRPPVLGLHPVQSGPDSRPSSKLIQEKRRGVPQWRFAPESEGETKWCTDQRGFSPQSPKGKAAPRGLHIPRFHFRNILAQDVLSPIVARVFSRMSPPRQP